MPDPGKSSVVRDLENGQSVLVTGGARSGKSRFSEELAGSFERVAYIATAQALDPEMAERIREHRQRRKADWVTVEEPLEVVACLREQAGKRDVLLLDCVTLWLSNLLAQNLTGEEITGQVKSLAGFLQEPGCRVICVTNEVGAGIVPENAVAREFRDLAGTTNQRLAAACHSVYWMAAGLPLRLK